MNRTVLITGGAKGIGRAIGLALAEQGWSVAVCYRHSEEAGAAMHEALLARGVPALAVRRDVSKPKDCEALVQDVHSELGEIHALVHCAGPYHRVPLDEESIEGWHEMFDSNLHPIFYLSRLVAPEMTRRGWGRILTFGMAGAERLSAQPNVTAHYIAKAGVLILTRTLAKLLGPGGVTVNSISPGFIDSGSTPLEELEKVVETIPAGYLGETSDVVAAAKYLLSDEARYVNGANLTLSGGWGV